MEKKELQARIDEYLASESHPVFRDEGADLVKTGNWDELTERFYTDLSFGTGGLRGIIGGGYNRMNPLVVRRATQGLAAYVKKHGPRDASAVIAYDSRNYSDLFALEAALLFAANGIKTYVFSSLRPTPELSYAVRLLSATTGIVVTASHNPPMYNGYKAYWADGGQVVPPHDTGIIAEVRAVKGVLPSITKEDAIAKGLLVFIDSEVDNQFIEMVKRQSLRPELVKAKGKDIKVVYTPLHGTGTFLVERTLAEMGITVTTVPEQREPDGNFPTVAFPNPEEASAMKLAVELGRKEKADLVMGTDPDADRIGIAVPSGDDFVLINGNQLGSLLADYILSSRKELGILPTKAAVIKTIVTTDLQRRIAESYGAVCFDVLTGFKYIAEKIREFETTGYSYVFGGEESYGFLVETDVRDKDAISAASMTAEMALYHVSQGRSILDALNDLYLKHGLFQETLISKHFEGQAGVAAMKSLMAHLRIEHLTSLGGIAVSEMRDYHDGTVTRMDTGSRVKTIDLPSSDVLQWVLADGSMVTARPSGTEPKIKFYASCREEVTGSLTTAKEKVDAKIAAIREDLGKIMAKFG